MRDMPGSFSVQCGRFPVIQRPGGPIALGAKLIKDIHHSPLARAGEPTRGYLLRVNQKLFGLGQGVVHRAASPELYEPLVERQEMTKHYSETHWRAAIYTALRQSPDGVAGFCAWAAEFRDRRIAPKTLYKKLDGSDPGERLSVDDAELITEYLLRMSPSQGGARSWIMALAARFDLAAIELDAPPPGGRAGRNSLRAARGGIA
ncbi:hypothetical protein G6F31_016149 [Rhizopus arrhizus]|nr:hypothetical protein G6F31_016149 [Rhizopus arrhizus]